MRKSVKDVEKEIPNILIEIENGESLISACKKHDITKGSFLYRVKQNKELYDHYVRACETRGILIGESIEQDMEDIRNKKLDPTAGRVIIDTKKWLASKMFPRMFGEKQAVEVTGKDGGSISITQDVDMEKIKQLKEMLGA